MPSKRFRVQLIVGVLTGALIVYFWLLASRAFILIGSGEPLAVALGIGVLLLPIIGVVLVVWELRFGWQSQALARRLAAEDRLYDDSELPRRASGRIEREAADAHFEVIRTEVEAAPDDWRGWYRLAQAYDLSGDRKRARSAMRHAIELAAAGRGAAQSDSAERASVLSQHCSQTVVSGGSVRSSVMAPLAKRILPGGRSFAAQGEIGDAPPAVGPG